MRLQAQELHVCRSGKDVLNGINFEVLNGEVYALLGGNGAGKSTTLLSFLGFLPILSGTAQVNGLNVSENIRAVRESIAYLPESISFYPYLNAFENIHYFLQLAGLNVPDKEVAFALDRVGLAENSRKLKLSHYSLIP